MRYGIRTYIEGAEIESKDYSFYGLIQAAMRKADSQNQAILRAAWPDVWEELVARYNAPGGYLEGEREL